ncbi:MAG: PAS domain S-box protein [Deltaproteobacteria bacterium]|nr:PAS domain S-box protein [Deltaproteobacteria bacterium]
MSLSQNPTPRILIIEDDLGMAHELKANLEGLGYQVSGPETTAEKGIALCEKDPPDLVLTAIALPGRMDGIEAAKIIRSRWGVPIVFLAAYADTDRLKRAQLLYTFGYLIKPFRDQDLKVSVEMALYLAKVNAERKKTEEALRYSEEKFSKIFKTSPDAIAIARTSDGVYLDVNESFCKITGYSKEEIIGHSALPGDLNLWVRREDRDPFAAALKETGEALGMEIPFRHQNGTIRNVLLSARVLDIEGDTCHIAVFTDIPERKQAEEALRASEEKFSKIFKTSPDAISITRFADGVYLDINDSFTKVTGFSKEEIIGRSSLPGSLDLWVNREDIQRLVASLEANAEAIGLEALFRIKNGTIISGLVSARVLVINGEICLLAIIRDVTAQRRQEQELRESEEKFRTIFENNAASTAIIEPDSTVSMINDAYCQMSGYAKEEVVGQSWTQLVPPADLERMEEYGRRRRINPQDAPARYEFSFYHKNGGIRQGLISASLIPSSRQLITSVIDITERLQAEEALRESEERHRNIIQTAMDGFWMVDRQGRLLEVNEAYCRMSGYSNQELLDMNIKDLDANETNDEVIAHIQQVELKGAVRFEARHRRKDGSIFDVEITAKYRATDGGRCEGFLRDITERKQTEIALKKSKDKLRSLSAHLQSIREEERANISREIHDDLGQLLTGLKMDLSWLLRHPHPDSTELQEKAQAMSQLVDQTVQTVRRISTELRPRILDDFGLVAALEWQAEEFSKKTGILGHFQSTRRKLDLKPDRSIAVFRIFQEALTNVARHSGASRVEASLRKDAQGLVLTIRDNGQGISEEGIGQSKSLGLVGMRERALILGGTFEIKSGKKEKGTTVILRLPITK